MKLSQIKYNALTSGLAFSSFILGACSNHTTVGTSNNRPSEVAKNNLSEPRASLVEGSLIGIEKPSMSEESNQNIAVASKSQQMTSSFESPTIIADLVPGVESSLGVNVGPSSKPSFNFPKLFEVNGKVVVLAYNPQFGNELHVVEDGKLMLLRDIAPGINSGFIDHVPSFVKGPGGSVYFEANDGTGRRVWKTDGSSAGTVLATTSAPVNVGALTPVSTPAGERLYFIADPQVSNADPSDEVKLRGGHEIWMVGADPRSTTKILEPLLGNRGSFLQALPASVIIGHTTPDPGSKYSGAWAYFEHDGSQLRLLRRNVGLSRGFVLNGEFHFGASVGAKDGNISKLVRTPCRQENGFEVCGTAVPVSQTIPGTARIYLLSQQDPTRIGSTLYFGGYSERELNAAGNLAGSELYKLDADGYKLAVDFDTRVPVENIKEGIIEGHGFVYLGPKVDEEHFLVVARDQQGYALYKTNGSTKELVLRADFSHMLQNPHIQRNFEVTPHGIFFTAKTRERGLEIYRTNGSAEGTVALEEINPGPADGIDQMGIFNYVPSRNALFFSGITANSGTELHALQLGQVLEPANR